MRRLAGQPACVQARIKAIQSAANLVRRPQTRLPPPSPAPPPNLITSPHSHPPAPARPFDAIQYPKDGPLAPHDPLQAQPLVPPVSQLARPPLPRLRPPLDPAKDARVACQAEESEWWGRSGAGSSAEAGAVARGDRLRVATRWSLCFRHSRSLPKMLVEWSANVGSLQMYSTYSGKWQASPRSLVLPALVPGKWTVSLNFDTARLALEWDADGAYKALKVGGGTIEAKAGGVSVWKVDVPAGTFPPSHGGVYRGGCVSQKG